MRVKLEAFPFTRYGTLGGKVLTVSNDAIPDCSPQQPSAAKEETARRRRPAGVSGARGAQ
ncbi:hypothetical protein NKI51_28940 [Mesorhizobium australicum]|uniref:hypothetical protein n=1 Tax=Mesorhizobium australicum TaxID=536018 RepID=UPI00333CC451